MIIVIAVVVLSEKGKKQPRREVPERLTKRGPDFLNSFLPTFLKLFQPNPQLRTHENP
jgi:hypothetical protein